MTYATTPETPPIHGEGESIHDMVIRDLLERKQFGLDKYGTILQAENGRDPLHDAYQEALDLACYLKQEIEKRRVLLSSKSCPRPNQQPPQSPKQSTPAKPTNVP